MDRVYQANAIETPPSTTASSGSYPTAGSKASGQLATVPGPYWFYSITEEIRNALIAAGVTPDAAKVNQLAEAMRQFLPLSGGTMTGDITCNRTNMYLKKNDANGRLIFNGGTKYDDGASLYLLGSGYSSDTGGFQLIAHNGTTSKVLKGLPDGSLTWGGNTVSTYDLTGRITELYSNNNGLDTGDIPLSQAYTNFKALCILLGSDDQGHMVSTEIVSVWEIQQRKATGTDNFMLVSGRHYWNVKASSTATKFVHRDNNCKLYKIWGIK